MFKSGLVAEQINDKEMVVLQLNHACVKSKQNYLKLEEVLHLGLGLEEVEKVNWKRQKSCLDNNEVNVFFVFCF